MDDMGDYKGMAAFLERKMTDKELEVVAKLLATLVEIVPSEGPEIVERFYRYRGIFVHNIDNVVKKLKEKGAVNASNKTL